MDTRRSFLISGAAALAAMNAGLAGMLRDGSITRLEKRYVR